MDSVEAFARALFSEIQEAVSSPDASTVSSSEMFTRVVMEQLEDAGHIDSAFDLYQEGHFGNATYRIDGYAFDETREGIDLFITIYDGTLPSRRITSTEAARAFDRALRFAKAAMDGLADKLEPSNTDASDLARHIQNKKSEISQIRVVLLTDSVLSGDLPTTNTWHGLSVQYECYDMLRLQRVVGDGQTREDISVDIVSLTGDALPCLHIAAEAGGYDAYLAVMPGEVLSRIYDRFGVRLLELNVRAFLGIQGRKSVNAELRRTIVETPSMFLAYNNGIVATVDRIDLDNDDKGRATIRALHGLQIVNGGQTTATLHRARKKESISLKAVEVPIKIIRVVSGDLTQMVGSVSRAANRQNSVQLADFSANDPFHQKIESLSNQVWLSDGRSRWFYERSRGSYLAAEQKAALRKTELRTFREQTPRTRRLSKLDLARYLSSWDGYPFRVCLGGQKNFQFFMQRVKDGGQLEPDADWFRRLIAVAIIYRTAERLVRQMKFPAYKAQIVAYMVAGIAHRTGGRLDFEGVWSTQKVSSQLEDLMRAWSPIIDAQLRKTAEQRNPGEWFKRAECWDTLKNALPDVIDPLPPELVRMITSSSVDVGPDRLNDVSALDLERIKTCMEVSSVRWLEAGEKGQQSGLLHWKLAGICRTLAGYAAGGWVKRPSPKQAKFALEALNLVEASISGTDS